jgi:hypothetical protein
MERALQVFLKKNDRENFTLKKVIKIVIYASIPSNKNAEQSANPLRSRIYPAQRYIA